MPSISILGTGRLDERESSYPQAILLPSGEILCSFNVGGGPAIHGGTEFARSSDGGTTSRRGGTILEATREPRCVNALKLTLSPDGRTIYAYGARLFREDGQKMGDGRRDAVLCTSHDDGRTWSAPRKVPMGVDLPLEVTHGVLPLSTGRLLAPAATLPSRERVGEQIWVAISDDGGQSWPKHSVAMEDPQKQHGYLEQKLAEIAPGRVMAAAWTVTFGDIADRPNSFAISNDGGSSWGPIRSTGIRGQTLTPLPLGGDRLLVVYNRRYGRQGVVASLVTFTDETWNVHQEELIYDADPYKARASGVAAGLASFDAFHFGFPTVIKLQDGTFLATHWCREDGKAGVRWTKLRIDWI